MRAVLDNSVILRGLMNPQSTWGALLARSAEYEHISGQPIIDEALNALRHASLRERLTWASEAPPDEMVRAAFSRALLVREMTIVPVCRDPKDDKFFACAVAGAAEYVVSEDADILAVGEYEGIRTVRAAEFLRLLDRAGLR